MTHCMEHLRLFLRNETNSGRGAEMLGARLRINGAIDRATPLDKELEGWSATGRPQTLSGRERLDYEAALARFRAQPPSRETVDPVSRKALETMLEKIEQLGATPVLIVPPTINKRCFLPSPEREKKTLVLNFCDFEKFPELYETRHRLDTEHLNEAGSGLFTEALVKMWADAVHGP